MRATWCAAVLGLVALPAAIVNVGCSAASGVTTAELAYVDGSIVGRADLFLDPTVDERPHTIEQLGGERLSAIPVEVEVFGHAAVAWRRGNDGSQLPRNGDNLIGLWRIHEVVEGEAAAHVLSATEGSEEGPVYLPGEEEVGTGSSEELSLVPAANIERLRATALLLVEWQNQRNLERDLELVEEVRAVHGPCI